MTAVLRDYHGHTYPLDDAEKAGNRFAWRAILIMPSNTPGQAIWIGTDDEREILRVDIDTDAGRAALRWLPDGSHGWKCSQAPRSRRTRPQTASWSTSPHHLARVSPATARRAVAEFVATGQRPPASPGRSSSAFRSRWLKPWMPRFLGLLYAANATGKPADLDALIEQLPPHGALELGVGHPDRSFVVFVGAGGGEGTDPGMPPWLDGAPDIEFDYGRDPVFCGPDRADAAGHRTAGGMGVRGHRSAAHLACLGVVAREPDPEERLLHRKQQLLAYHDHVLGVQVAPRTPV